LTIRPLATIKRWHFAQFGNYLERIDVTSRIIAINVSRSLPRRRVKLLRKPHPQNPLDERAALLLL
jgi:uncharacterized alpha-E superfamily protein